MDIDVEKPKANHHLPHVALHPGNDNSLRRNSFGGSSSSSRPVVSRHYSKRRQTTPRLHPLEANRIVLSEQGPGNMCITADGEHVQVQSEGHDSPRESRTRRLSSEFLDVQFAEAISTMKVDMPCSERHGVRHSLRANDQELVETWDRLEDTDDDELRLPEYSRLLLLDIQAQEVRHARRLTTSCQYSVYSA